MCLILILVLKAHNSHSLTMARKWCSLMLLASARAHQLKSILLQFSAQVNFACISFLKCEGYLFEWLVESTFSHQWKSILPSSKLKVNFINCTFSIPLLWKRPRSHGDFGNVKRIRLKGIFWGQAKKLGNCMCWVFPSFYYTFQLKIWYKNSVCCTFPIFAIFWATA